MKYFKPTALSSSRRPELGKNESLLAQQGQIGLYEGYIRQQHFLLEAFALLRTIPPLENENWKTTKMAFAT